MPEIWRLNVTAHKCIPRCGKIPQRGRTLNDKQLLDNQTHSFYAPSF